MEHYMLTSYMVALAFLMFALATLAIFMGSRKRKTKTKKGPRP